LLDYDSVQRLERTPERRSRIEGLLVLAPADVAGERWLSSVMT